MAIGLERVYDAVEPLDGKRILVDRLWPRGLRKPEAGMDKWLGDVAQSDQLWK